MKFEQTMNKIKNEQTMNEWNFDKHKKKMNEK